MGLLLLALGVYCSCIAVVWMISNAYADLGFFGIILLVVALFGGAFLAKKTSEDNKKEK